MRGTECSEKKKTLADMSCFLKDIAENNRLKIICLLKKGELCVCEIIGDLKLPHNLVSHHLNILKKLKVVSYRKKGRFRLYKLNRDRLKTFTDDLAEIFHGISI